MRIRKIIKNRLKTYWQFLIISIYSITIVGCTAPKLMDYSKFSKLDNIQLPKILHLTTNSKGLLYFGTYHSNNPKDSLFNIINNKFNTFDPDFVLYEGANWPIYNNVDSIIQTSGEPGFIISLCNGNGIIAQSIEPKEAEEYRTLLHKYDLDWVVLMYLCRQIDQQQRFAELHRTSDEQFEKNISYFLVMLKNNGIPLDTTQMSYKHWRNKYRELLNKDLEWRKFNPHEYYPNFNFTRMNEINRASDSFRNQYMIQKIMESLEEYNKVMVLVGGGHLIIQESYLRHKFKKKFHQKNF